MQAAAQGAGLPPDALLALDEVSLEATQELMRCRETSVILATGGLGLVRAAYSSGKPAYGVGPGNVPAYVEKTADVPKAVKDVIDGKTFDNGTLCSSEQALVCDEAVAAAVREEAVKNGGYFLSEAEAAAVAACVVTRERLANPEIVGKPAVFIAEKAGLKVPPETRVLVAPLSGVGRDFPLSIEKLSPGPRLLRGAGLARRRSRAARPSCASGAPATRWACTPGTRPSSGRSARPCRSTGSS